MNEKIFVVSNGHVPEGGEILRVFLFEDEAIEWMREAAWIWEELWLYTSEITTLRAMSYVL